MIRRPTLIVAALCIPLCAGCTPSVGEPDSFAFSGGEPRSVAQPLELVGNPGDLQVLQALASAYEASGGSPVTVTATPTDDSDRVAWDVADGTPIGRETWCVVADQAWFSVNQLDMPQTSADLTDKRWAPLVSIGDTEADQEWLASLDDSASFLKKLEKAGGQTDSEPRLRVASGLEPWLTANNLGTSSQWVALPETCTDPTDLLVDASGESAAAFVDYLRSVPGQAELALAGLAYPLDPAELPEQVQVVAPDPFAAQ